MTSVQPKKLDAPVFYTQSHDQGEWRYSLFESAFLNEIRWTETGRPLLPFQRYPIQRTGSFKDDEYIADHNEFVSHVSTLNLSDESGNSVHVLDMEGNPIPGSFVWFYVRRTGLESVPYAKTETYHYFGGTKPDNLKLPRLVAASSSTDLSGTKKLITSVNRAWFVQHYTRSVVLQTTVYLAPEPFVQAGFAPPIASVRGAMALDGRHAMVSTLVFGNGDASDFCGWAIEVFDTETGALVGSAKQTDMHHSPDAAGTMKCLRFPDILMAVLDDQVVAFDQTQPDRFHVRSTSDFLVPATKHLFAEGERVVTHLEPMVDRSLARAVQSDGRTVVYSVVRAPSSGSLFLLDLVEIHKTVDILKKNVRCAISPDGLHLLTLSACEDMKITCDVIHHDVWGTIRHTCMALDAAEKGKHVLGCEDNVRHLSVPSVSGQIVAFLLPETGIRRRHRLQSDPNARDSLDILPEL